MSIIKFQIGKLGVTSGVCDSMLLAFKNNKAIRISALKSSGRDRDSIAKIAEEIKLKLSEKSNSSYTYRIIGFTIIMRKHPRS